MLPGNIAVIPDLGFMAENIIQLSVRNQIFVKNGIRMEPVV